MSEQKTEMVLHQEHQQAPSIYSSAQTFEDAQRICKMLCTSTLVPKDYQGNLPNTMIAYEMSVRTGMSPFMVMQNLDIIQGRPSWSSKYVIAALNACGRFSPIQFQYNDLGTKNVEYTETQWVPGGNGQRQKKTVSKTITINDRECSAYARNAFGDIIVGPKVSIEMAVKEGWYTKDNSKWLTMPELMLSYRSAKFFGNLYAPDVLMGLQSSDEIIDISTNVNGTSATVVEQITPITILNESLTAKDGGGNSEEDEELM